MGQPSGLEDVARTEDPSDLRQPTTGGRHHPNDMAEFYRWFSSTESATECLTDVAVLQRPGLSALRALLITAPGGPRWWSGNCRRWFTLTAHTLMERTPVSNCGSPWLGTWFRPRLGLKPERQVHHGRQLRHGVAPPQKMRVAMDQDGRDKLDRMHHGVLDSDDLRRGVDQEQTRSSVLPPAAQHCWRHASDHSSCSRCPPQAPRAAEVVSRDQADPDP